VVAALRAPLAEALGAFAGVFRVPNLRRLELAYAFSLIGLWAYSVPIVVYSYQEGGAALVGVSGVLRLLPALVVSPFAAVLVDRYSRRLVLLSTDVTRALLAGLIALAVALDLPVLLVMTLGAVMAMASTAFEPAKNAIVPSLVEEPDQLTAANVATSSFESSGIFVGPAIGGLLLAVGSVEAAFAATGVLLACSALLLARIQEPPRGDRSDADGAPDGLVVEALAGIRAVAADPRLRLVVGLFGAQVVVSGALAVFVVVIALELLEMGEGAVGLFDSAAGLGGLLGSLVALAIAGRRGLGTLFGLGIVGWGVPLMLIPLVPEPAFVLLMFAVIGVANTVGDSAGYTLMQRATTDEVRGRVFGAFETLILAAIGLGTIGAAGLVELLGRDAALVVTGATLPALVLLCAPGLRRLDAEAGPPDLALLRGVPMFAPLAPASLELLASQLERLHVGPGEEVIRQGAVGDRFYVIESGEVEVFEDGVFARRQGAGDFFGEIALIRDVPRTATVRAVTDLELLALERELFIAAVTGHAPSAEAADAVIDRRLDSVRAGAGAV
jgi:MFS family permease